MQHELSDIGKSGYTMIRRDKCEFFSRQFMMFE